jgi:hypothetical protein
MTKNPFINAAAALAYIVLVVLIINYLSRHTGPDNKILAPITFLSLLTLSAATMGYIFFFEPVRMYLDGHKKAGMTLFVQTLAVFGVITILILVLLLSGIFS